MPHRRSPKGVARNFILQNAKFDRLKKESLNTVGLGEVLTAVRKVFPNISSDDDVLPEGYEGLGGLVLQDPRGEGALNDKHKNPKERFIPDSC